MLLYQQTAAPATLWPEPQELLWQMQPADWELKSRWKRPDITISDRAFIAAVMNIPREQRPWGAIVWLSEVYNTSRQTLYTIGAQVRRALLFPNQETKLPERQPTLLLPPPSLTGPTVTVTDTRLKRAILTLLLPGGVTPRPMQDCLTVAVDVNRSIGFLSQFINEEERRAEKVLERKFIRGSMQLDAPCNISGCYLTDRGSAARG